MFGSSVIHLLHISLLSQFVPNCQSDPLPVLSSNGLNSPRYSSPGNEHPNRQLERGGGDFAGFWTGLLGGEGCGGCNQCSNCSGCSRCGNGAGIVNNVVNKNNYYNININNNNYYPGPVTVDPVASTSSTTTPVASCQVSIYGGTFALSVCGQEAFPTTSVTGCPFSRISFQLMNLPCAYVQNDGSIVFDYIGFGCAVGQVYYGTLTATDTWTGTQLSSATITVDTTNLQNCITTVTATPTPTSMLCTVSYPHGQYSSPYLCNMLILEPADTPGCALYQVSYQLTSMPCNQVQNDGSVIVSLVNYGNGCDVGPGIIYSGTLTATDSYSGNMLGIWNIQMDTSSLSHCIGTTPTATTTTDSTYPQLTCNVTAMFYQTNFSPSNCSQRLFTVLVGACSNTGASNYIYQYALSGLPSCVGLSLPFYPNFAASVIFTPIMYDQIVCDVGQGIQYSGNMTATIYDTLAYTSTVHTWPFTVDTSGLEYCVGTFVWPYYQNCYVVMNPEYLPPAFRPTSCNRTILATATLKGENCEDFQYDVAYGVSGFESCAAVQFVDGILFFEVSSDKPCNVGGGQQHLGTAIAYNSLYNGKWKEWSVKLLTGGVQHCAGEWGQLSTSTSATTVGP